MKIYGRYVTILRMIRAGIIAVVLCAGVGYSQQPEQNKLVVIVQDQSGAVIPGAGVRATEESTNRIFDAVADQTGQAEFHLPKGNFTIRVQARGFATWSRAGFDPAHEMQLRVTMILSGDEMTCTMACFEPIYIAPEDDVHYGDPAVAAEIPLLPLQTLGLRAKHLRLKTHAG